MAVRGRMVTLSAFFVEAAPVTVTQQPSKVARSLDGDLLDSTSSWQLHNLLIGFSLCVTSNVRSSGMNEASTVAATAGGDVSAAGEMD
ncbi:hypothetical protein CpipJ_CPIJ008333 [Culex quinquefasciatus]|uniref:Uncharacterized protein n=1 Tax=Culex quinquefasciatus TaxID=7176 RepID=B0WLY3_CULQU|nr:hypothetical protein CpipJ_CPIJ008333 [Culex quinquefasciatus]|eukprot:XP_001849717.1 hypothetical protein CpipJ_CPIJ008333 [Culex quinquefasciatus]